MLVVAIVRGAFISTQGKTILTSTIIINAMPSNLSLCFERENIINFTPLAEKFSIILIFFQPTFNSCMQSDIKLVDSTAFLYCSILSTFQLV